MTQETSLSIALKEAVQTMSKKQQVKLITDHLYNKYEVFSKFKPLAIGIDDDLVKALPQYDQQLVLRALSNHCRRPKYLKQLVRGGKRFNLHGKVKGEVTEEEKKAAQEQSEALSKQLTEKTLTKEKNIEAQRQRAEAKAKAQADGQKPGDAQATQAEAPKADEEKKEGEN